MLQAAMVVGLVGAASAPASPIEATCDPRDGQLTLVLQGFSLRVVDPGFVLQSSAERGAPSPSAREPKVNEIPPTHRAGASTGSTNEDAPAVAARSATPAPSSSSDVPLQLTGIVQGPHTVAGSGTWLVAVRLPQGGIYRLRRTAEEVTSTRLAEGSALRLCDHGSGVGWAALAREGRVALVRLSTADDTVISRTVAAAVTEAMRASEDDEISADVLLSVLDVADKAMWPDADAVLWAAVQHRSPVVRREAASWVSRAVARATVDVALLWLLAHDDDVQVRRSAFAAAKELCGSGARGTVCAELLGYFRVDPEQQIGWGARDLLLTFDPERALQGAPAAYKLDALAALGVRLETDASAPARRALDLLVQDLDPGVRRTAVLIMNRLEP